VLKNALLIIGSLAIALLAFEMLLWARPDLRAASDGPSFVFCQGPSQRYRQDPVFRKAEIPGSIYFEHNGERWSIHLNNDRGFRDVFDSGNQHAIILGDRSLVAPPCTIIRPFPTSWICGLRRLPSTISRSVVLERQTPTAPIKPSRTSGTIAWSS
jgi:hypothetical protein